MSTQQVVQQVVEHVTANPLAAPDHVTANLANAVTAIYGLSGAGKTSLAVTAVEYCWERHQKIAMYYVADLGGFGTKLLAAVRAGIALVYDPRNHVDPFATMEAISHGAFPAYLLPGGPATREERERGYAPPDAELIMPHRRRYTIKGTDGAVLGQVFDVPTAQTLVGQHPGATIATEVVRSKGFGNVGLRVYDSMTSLNDWGMADLQEQSAKGLLPVGSGGGSALGGADALRSGGYVFGTSSKAQFGFLQQRSYGWLANIRAIPDQAVPPVVTFMVEQSKGDDESGGLQCFGPKIAGNARTSSVGGWVGNLCYAAREPNAEGAMVHRLWLTNHVAPNDARNIPYLAKHRGTPLGMPDYLEDAPGKPWEVCSLAVLFTLLDKQVAAVEAELKQRFPNAPGMQFQAAEEQDVVVREVKSAMAAAPGGARTLAPAAPIAQPGAQPAPSMPARRRVAAPPPSVAAPAAANQPPPPVAQVAQPTPASGAAPASAPSSPAPMVQAPVVVPAGVVVQGSPMVSSSDGAVTQRPVAPPAPQTPSAPRGVATRSRSPRPPV